MFDIIFRLFHKIKAIRCWWNHGHAYVCINKDLCVYTCVHCNHLLALAGSFSTVEFEEKRRKVEKEVVWIASYIKSGSNMST